MPTNPVSKAAKKKSFLSVSKLPVYVPGLARRRRNFERSRVLWLDSGNTNIVVTRTQTRPKNIKINNLLSKNTPVPDLIKSRGEGDERTWGTGRCGEISDCVLQTY